MIARELIAVVTSSANRTKKAQTLANTLNLPFIDVKNSGNYRYLLNLTETHLALQQTGEKSFRPIYVDFLSGKLAYRRQHGGGRNQLIAKAVGLKPGYRPTVIDATAGLGEDGFVLASLGCHVQMLERSPIVAALLADGLARAKQNTSFSKLHLSLWEGDAVDYLRNLPPASQPDVIYLDPMYPVSQSSALPKKEMRTLRDIVGHNEDVTPLFEQAIARAKRRVVVKRPRLAPALSAHPADFSVTGRSSRFDVYLRHA